MNNNINSEYKDCLNYLYSQLPMYQRIGAVAYKVDIDNTVKLAHYFGNPHEHLKCIHIAGTNGKTSISHFLSSILQQQGYKTGLYTSPHLVDFRERIMINSEMIDKKYVCDFVNQNKKIFEEIKPSFFEMCVIMAFCWFKDNNIDYAVIEVGMGGRLDSTNIINPLVSIITNIGLDHIQFLGDTLPKIAYEKAGIIKKDKPVIISETQPEIKDIFINKAKDNNSPIYFADSLIMPKGIKQNNNLLTFDADSLFSKHTYRVESNLTGKYEVKNICAVLLCIDILKKGGIEINDSSITIGLKSTVLRGRWDIIHKDPIVVCDTGHNTEGITEVLNMISQIDYDRLHIVFGAVNDKDVSKTIKLFPSDAEYYLCKPDIPRGMKVDLLSQHFEKENYNFRTFNSCGDALAAAMLSANKTDLIYVGGSTFVVADVLLLLEH